MIIQPKGFHDLAASRLWDCGECHWGTGNCRCNPRVPLVHPDTHPEMGAVLAFNPSPGSIPEGMLMPRVTPGALDYSVGEIVRVARASGLPPTEIVVLPWPRAGEIMVASFRGGAWIAVRHDDGTEDFRRLLAQYGPWNMSAKFRQDAD